MKNKKMEKKVILPEDAEKLIEEVQSPTYKVNGQIYHKKSSAIYSVITHNKCECGNLMERGWTSCQQCRLDKRNKVYDAMSFMEWDGNVPLVLFDSDEYFFGVDEIYDYIYTNELDTDEIDELKFVICSPNRLRMIDYDYWSDYFPEDYDPERQDPELVKKLDEFNSFLQSYKPISWSESKFKTKVHLEFE
jgi:hypothetical protein